MKRKIINFKNLFLFFKKFFNGIIRSGKKDKSENLFLVLCIKLKSKGSSLSIYEFLNNIMLNLTPIIGFRPKHLGRMRYNIPVPIKNSDRIILAVKWLKQGIADRKELKFEDRVFNELSEIYNKNVNCSSLKQKKYHYKEAFLNKSFTKYLRKFKSKRR